MQAYISWLVQYNPGLLLFFLVSFFYSKYEFKALLMSPTKKFKLVIIFYKDLTINKQKYFRQNFVQQQSRATFAARITGENNDSIHPSPRKWH